MTDARDNPNMNKYPGEVRAGELKFIREIVEKKLSEHTDIQAVIFSGDFNIDITSDLSMLEGQIPGYQKIPTGFQSRALHWGKFTLLETHANVHKWGENFTGNVCTSYNVSRCSWIDMMWYSNHSLVVEQYSQNFTPKSQIPDKDNPSDHLPISAIFSFKESDVHNSSL